MSEDNFEKTLTRCIFTGLCVVTLTIGSCQSYENHTENKAMVDMVKAGSTAIEAMCAVKSAYQDSCSIIASKYPGD